MKRIPKTTIAPEAFALKVARGDALDRAIGRAILGDNRVSILIEIGGELAMCDGLAFDVSYAGGEGVLRISQGALLKPTREALQNPDAPTIKPDALRPGIVTSPEK